MNAMHRYHSLFLRLSVILSGLVFLALEAVADSITVSEAWKDNAVAGVYANAQDTGTFNASLAVPGLSSLTANGWSNLLVTIYSSSLNIGQDSLGAMADAPSSGGTVSSTSATFYSQSSDTNGDWVNAYKMSFSRSGNTLTIAGQTLNPASMGSSPWSIVAQSYWDYSGLGTTSPITDQVDCEVVLEDATTLDQYVDIVRTIYMSGTDTITYDSLGSELDNIRVSGAADYQAPTIQITAPTSGQRWSNAVFTVTGKAGDNVKVSNVFYSVNNSAWAIATTGDNWTNWTAESALTPGTNTVAAYAVDTSGNVSATNTVRFVYILTAVLTVQVNPGGTVVTNYNGLLLPIGQTFSMTAKTNVGFAFSGWTGSITTNSPKLTFVMASNLVFTANFADIAKPALTITAPANGQKMTNALAHVKGNASDNWGVGTVLCQLNGGAWKPATTTNGWTNWSVTLPLLSGTNTVKAYAVDLGGNTSATNTVSVTSSNTFKMQLSFASAEPMSSNGLSLKLDSSAGINSTIQVSSNLVNWTVLTNFVGTNGALSFRDSAATGFNRRFYRAVTQ